MYGTYELPFEITVPGLDIKLIKEKFGYRYIRDLGDGLRKELNILTDNAKMIINPVEPLNYPQNITNYLLLELKEQLVIEPNSEKKIYLSFPIEIGFFLSTRSNLESLDEISLLPVKYTLYGDPKNGVIARYFLTEVYDTMPRLDPAKFGALELNIRNTESDWNKVTKIVLNAYDMKLKYNVEQVKMNAQMKILNEVSAETDCYLPPFEKGFKKSKEIFRAKKLHIISTKFTMLEGI